MTTTLITEYSRVFFAEQDSGGKGSRKNNCCTDSNSSLSTAFFQVWQIFHISKCFGQNGNLCSADLPQTKQGIETVSTPHLVNSACVPNRIGSGQSSTQNAPLALVLYDTSPEMGRGRGGHYHTDAMLLT